MAADRTAARHPGMWLTGAARGLPYPAAVLFILAAFFTGILGMHLAAGAPGPSAGTGPTHAATAPDHHTAGVQSTGPALHAAHTPVPQAPADCAGPCGTDDACLVCLCLALAAAGIGSLLLPLSTHTAGPALRGPPRISAVRTAAACPPSLIRLSISRT